MSKSYHNAIYMSDSPDKISETVAKMVTDPQRARKNDPGNPDVCNVYEFHKLYSGDQTVKEIAIQCRAAEIGCVACKKIMAGNLAKALEPIREKRAYYETRPKLVDDIINAGDEKAGKVIRQTMEEVRAAIKM